MAEIVLKLSERERRQIEKIAADQGELIGRIEPVTVAEMAGALLSAHLILVKDCGGILPAAPARLKGGKVAGKIKGKGGVSLSGGF